MPAALLYGRCVNAAETEPILEVALSCARAAGAVLRRTTAEGFTVSSKAVEHDLVTTADLESEGLIVEMIRQRFPSHDVEAEEGKYPLTGARLRWVIDPIDGTVNFAKGVPFFCVSIGVTLDGEPLAAVVHDPSRDETFWATAGGGAYLDGRRIEVTETELLRDALLATGFHYDRGQRMLDTLETIKRFFLGGVVEVRRIGSAALELAYVAAGRLDGFWEHRLMSWDIAAGMLLVREAGGRATNRDGQDLEVRSSFTVASNGLIHDAMLEVIRSVGEG
jgi:myo-inositol-1(or 4)-monophosphatase